MKNIIAKVRTKLNYHILNDIIAFLFPVFSMLIICKISKMYPFGEKSWLIMDMDNQYVSYFSYLREALNKHGLFYSFSKNLGGDMLGFTAYYLISPLNILFVISNKTFLPNMIAIVSFIKIGLCGFTFQKLLNYNQKKWSNLLFSTSYALMGYVIFYLSNIMWFDAVYMLPIIILGIKKTVDHEKSVGYILALGYAILTNYYISYMICIFAVLYFLYYLFCCNDEKLAKKSKIALRFCISSLIAGGLCMWLLLPAKYALDGVKGSFDLSKLSFKKNFYWNDIFAKLMPFSTEDLMKSMPNVYCGLFVLFFIVIFFFSVRVQLKRKIGMLLLFGILYLSLYIDGANLIWHGFNYPIGFPYRNSFILSFLMILCASEGFEQTFDMNPRNKIVAGAGAFIVLSAVIWMVQRKQMPFIASNVYLYAFVLLLVTFCIYLLTNRKTYAVVLFGAVLLISYDLICNGQDIFSKIESMPVVYYEIYHEQTNEQVKYIQNYDDNFYRMEKNFYRTMNDPMMYDYAGLSHYSSSEPSDIKAFLGDAGFRNNGNFAFYNRGSTLSMESFLGVKYLLSRQQLNEPYQYVGKTDSTYLYKNPFAFSIGFLTDANLEEFPTQENNKFEFQNEIFAATCFVEEIFTRQTDYQTQLTNLADLGNGTFQKIENSNEAYIEYSFTVDSDYPIYLYLDSNHMKLAQVELNGKDTGKYFDVKQYDIIHVQDYIDVKKGEELKIKVKALESVLQINDVQIYYENRDYLKSCYNYQNENSVKLNRISDSFIKGVFDNTDGRYHMIFTIPFSKGWKVYIDGKKIKSVDKTGIFLSISDVPAGEHELILKYVPVGFEAGVVIAILAFLLLILMIYHDKDKNTNYGKSKKSFIALVLLCCVVWIIASLYEPKPLVKNPIQSPRIDQTVCLGSMEQDGNIANGKEPIEWEVLEIKDGKALLVSKNALAAMPYAGESITAVWENSAVRKWANNEFYQQAFTDEERNSILLTKVDNKGCSTKFTDAGADTEDYVFILDKGQIEKYYGISACYDEELVYSQNAICTPTKYAMETANEYQYISEELYEKILKRRGYSDEIIGKTSCNYWVRNPGLYTTINTLTADDTGSVFEIGTFSTNKCYVRPAIWVDIDLFLF